jgi:Amt family ammonium transporter
MLASASGCLVAMLYMWMTTGKPDPSMSANGLLAGLVAITAPCAFVNSISAFVIGGIAGILVCLAVLTIDQKLQIDDPVGAISVHGVNGIWGVLSVGIFADGTYGDGWNGVEGTVKGLLYGDASQFVAELIGSITVFVFVFGMFYAFFKVCAAIWGIRVSAEAEMEGIDIPEVGALAYPDFSLVPTHGFGSGMGSGSRIGESAAGAHAMSSLRAEKV